MSLDQPTIKGLTKSGSEQLQDHDGAGDGFALAAFSEAMDSVQDGSVLLWWIFVNICASLASKNKDEGRNAKATAKCRLWIPAKDYGLHQADNAVMNEENAGKEEQPAVLDTRTVRPRARPSLGRVIRSVSRPI